MASQNPESIPVETTVPDPQAPEGDDPLRQYLSRRELVSDRERILFPTDERRIQDLARDRVPKTIQQAEDSLSVVALDNNQMKACLKVLNVAGAHNARQVIKRKIIAVKLVQHKLAVGTLSECIADLDKERPSMVTDKHRLVRKLPRTGVRVVLSPSGALERLAWLRGDVPTYDDEGEVVPGKSAHEAGETEEDIIVQQADFEPMEYCRLLHVLADQRMSEARAALIESRSTHDLWSKEIAPLFNDESFAPEAVRQVAGGVRNSDIAEMTPQIRQYVRDPVTLKRKFSELKSMYRAAVRNYMQAGQNEFNPFRNFSQDWPFVMYAFCLSKVYTEIQPLLSRTLASDMPSTQGRTRESDEGVPARKRRISVSDTLSYPGVHTVQLPKPSRETSLILRETHKAEREKALSEAAEAHGKAVSSLIDAIRKSRGMLEGAVTEEDRVLYANLVKDLKVRLTNVIHSASADGDAV